jgi:hypoxanthine-guanine phosphoribosyltransferase
VLTVTDFAAGIMQILRVSTETLCSKNKAKERIEKKVTEVSEKITLKLSYISILKRSILFLGVLFAGGQINISVAYAMQVFCGTN